VPALTQISVRCCIDNDYPELRRKSWWFQ